VLLSEVMGFVGYYVPIVLLKDGVSGGPWKREKHVRDMR